MCTSLLFKRGQILLTRGGGFLQFHNKKKHKLLYDTGRLKDGLDFKTNGNQITITSDVKYANIHNQGGKAGKGLKANIPKRQFVGMTNELKKIIKDSILNKFKNALK